MITSIAERQTLRTTFSNCSVFSLDHLLIALMQADGVKESVGDDGEWFFEIVLRTLTMELDQKKTGRSSGLALHQNKKKTQTCSSLAW